MRSFLLSIVVALLMVAGLAPTAGASDGWCDTDPVLLITTPGGSQVPVYINTSVWGAEHLPAAQTARMTYSATSVSNGSATNVEVTVVVPNDAFSSRFPTRTGASSGPYQTGTVYAQTTYGYSGQPMNLQFRLTMP